MTGMKSTNRRTLDLVYIALFAVLTAVCSWISIPAVVPFTLQTFAVFCAVGLLGGKRGTLSIVVYIFLGIAGMTVFDGFTGGVGALFGAAGGYLLGFVFIGLIYWLITGLFGTKPLVSVVAMILGLLACYAFGTVWFMAAYARKTGAVGLTAALGWCVFPFILPDLAKMGLAFVLTRRLSRHIRI